MRASDAMAIDRRNRPGAGAGRSLAGRVAALVVVVGGLLAAWATGAGAGTEDDPDRWQPEVGASWQWQLTGDLDPSFDVDVYDVDLFDTPAAAVDALHADGRRVLCYVSVGSWEDWRPDADRFPASVIGEAYEGWPGERWLDVRRIDLLAPILGERLDRCAAKGFDGVEPDNVDGYLAATGFDLTADDQVRFVRWLAGEAHARGLSIGLKNAEELAATLVADLDWAMTEDCYVGDWCEAMAPFVAAGKPVFMAEYTDRLTAKVFHREVCPLAAALGFSPILKDRDLDAERVGCAVPDS